MEKGKADMKIKEPRRAVAWDPVSIVERRSLDRLGAPSQHTLAAELIDWLGKLTLSGGDLDGQKLQVWPWEKAFIRGTFSQPGNAAISVSRSNGKSVLLGALSTAVVFPGGPLHGARREVICVASSFRQSREIYEDVIHFARGLGHDLSDRSKWRLQDSANSATIEYRATGARIRCLGSDPRRAHGLRPFLVLADEGRSNAVTAVFMPGSVRA